MDSESKEGSSPEQDNTLIGSLFSKGQERLEYKKLETYFLPKPADNTKMPQKKQRGKQKKASKNGQILDFGQDMDDMEKERHTLKVLEGILREREEMLSLHEQKVVALKEEYDAKIRQLESSDAAPEAAGRRDKKRGELARLEEEHSFLESLLLERRRELEKLRDEELRLQMEISRHSRDIIEHQKKFDSLHKAIAKLESHHRQKQNEFDDLSYKAEMKKKEHEAISSETAKARKELDRLGRSITYDIESEIAVLAKRVDDHLRHSDYLRARKDYNRIRELYTQLSREEKQKVYDKVAKVAAALTA